jgi:hypothetical protein
VYCCILKPLPLLQRVPPLLLLLLLLCLLPSQPASPGWGMHSWDCTQHPPPA